ncbi:MAG: hypothetical protein V1743_04100 [Nanoarchaeota archaeon]
MDDILRIILLDELFLNLSTRPAFLELFLNIVDKGLDSASPRIT